jgi:hypothetical protein
MAIQNPFSTRAGNSVFNAAAATPKPTAQQATQITPSADSKVSDQLNNLLDENSRYLQSARARSNQAANARGLINSSIGVGAGESAAINAALPIAQQDAQTSFSAQQLNQSADNTFKLDDNKFQQQDYFQSRDAAFANAADENQFGRTLDLQNNQQEFQGAQSAAERLQRENLLNKELGFQGDQAKLNRDLQLNLQQIDATTRQNLAGIEADYKTLLQTSANSQELFRETTKNIAAIQLNEKLDAAAKKVLVEEQEAMLKNAMVLQGALSKLNLGELVNFG